MQRACKIAPAETWDETKVVDYVALDAGDRQRRRMVMTGERGTTFLLDLDKPATLRDGDGLLLDDGSIIVVAGKPEPLVEIATRAKPDIVRLAWHIGNRHAELQVVGHTLRIRRDHVLEDMLRKLGAAVTEIEAPFEPEPASPHGHDHDR